MTTGFTEGLRGAKTAAPAESPRRRPRWIAPVDIEVESEAQNAESPVVASDLERLFVARLFLVFQAKWF